MKFKPIRIFGQFNRVDDSNPDYTIVEGYAYVNAKVSSDRFDLQRSAMQRASENYMQFPAVREMHNALGAAGTGMEIEWDERGVKLTTKIVDTEARLKVREGVYRGFSVGVVPVKVQGNQVIECKWIETSLVDRPADPDAVFTMVRTEDVGEEVEVEEVPIDRSDFNAYMKSQEPHHLRYRAAEWLDSAIYDAQKHPIPEERAALVSQACDQHKAYMTAAVQSQALQGSAVLDLGEGPKHPIGADPVESSGYNTVNDSGMYADLPEVTRKISALEAEKIDALEQIERLSSECNGLKARIDILERTPRRTEPVVKNTHALPKEWKPMDTADPIANVKERVDAEAELARINGMSSDEVRALTQDKRNALVERVSVLKSIIAQ